MKTTLSIFQVFEAIVFSSQVFGAVSENTSYQYDGYLPTMLVTDIIVIAALGEKKCSRVL